MALSEPARIVLTIATADWAERFRVCIDRPRGYAERHCFEHRLVDPVAMRLNPKWSKLDIAVGLLRKGHDVLLIDADAEIDRTCPPFTAVLEDLKARDIFF